MTKGRLQEILLKYKLHRAVLVAVGAVWCFALGSRVFVLSDYAAGCRLTMYHYHLYIILAYMAQAISVGCFLLTILLWIFHTWNRKCLKWMIRLNVYTLLVGSYCLGVTQIFLYAQIRL
ncbi:MAG: hypothetical protein LBT22_05670 [Peptococcaceae bacterium]|jgi:hypothetical protein|nr:hypothetical protein [Peptococcaceae bacterium]